MDSQSGAMSVAEEKYAFKTDVNLIFGNQSVTRTHVLRTTLHSLPIWKTRNANVSVSPHEDRSASVIKEAAIIDREMCTFGIDATRTEDIVAAVKFLRKFY